jgi:hypothetical protein
MKVALYWLFGFACGAAVMAYILWHLVECTV